MSSDYSKANSAVHHLTTLNSHGDPSRSSAPIPHHVTAADRPYAAFHGGRSTGAVDVSRRSSSQLGSVDLGNAIKTKSPAFTASGRAKKSSQQQSSAASTSKTESARLAGRIAHNSVERRYRENLRDQIEGLRAVVPALYLKQNGHCDSTSSHTMPRVSKGTILSMATEYIYELEQANRTLTIEFQHLLRRLQTLEAMLQNSETRPPQYALNQNTTTFDQLTLVDWTWGFQPTV